MNRKLRNRVFVTFVILIAIIVAYILSPVANQLNTKDAYCSNQVKIKNATYFNNHTSNDMEYPDFQSNYKSVDLNKKVDLTGSYFQKTPQQSSMERLYKNNSSNLQVTFNGSTVQNANSFNNNNGYVREPNQFRTINVYKFENERKIIALINLRTNLNFQEHGFYSINSDLTSLSIYSSNYVNERRIEIGGPGDQPNTNPIPVPDGVYYLLILAGVYAGWKWFFRH